MGKLLRVLVVLFLLLSIAALVLGGYRQLGLTCDPVALLSSISVAAALAAMADACIDKSGVDGIITDRPGLANRVWEERGELEVHERLLVQLASRLGSDYGEAP